MLEDEKKDGAWDDVRIFQDGAARAVPVPPNADRTTAPVTDGAHVYFLLNTEQTRPPTRRLVSVSLSGGEQVLVSDATELVTPRGIFASPDAGTLAFFLDSVRGELTELWTYDPQKGVKRLALERLSKGTLGPFWDPEGGFLARDGNVLLRGSPQRTGGDTLPLQRSWDDALPGDTLLPSPGGMQVVYATRPNRADRTTRARLRVWDASGTHERDVGVFPDSQVRLLGWSSTGALLVATDNEPATFWEIRKGVQETFPLPDGSMSPTLSSDGARVAVLHPQAGGIELLILDAATKATVATYPVTPAGQSAAKNTPLRGLRLLQFLRSPEQDASRYSTSGVPLASEAIVEYVSEHVREIAEAPVGEPVSAERIRFTTLPGTVYVDYRIGTTLWRRLIHVDGQRGAGTRHVILGIFAPVAGEWVLARGADLPGGQTALLFEFEPDVRKWVRKETTEDVHP
jgi:hypothetical protein